MKIAIVGAPRTGKTTLVEALQLALPASANPMSCTVVEDVALLSAMQQDLLLQDPSLYPAALARHRSYDLTLLTGLDLPATASENDKQTPAQWDARLRQVLDGYAIAYAVVYGSGQARTDCALQAIAYHRSASSTRSRPSASSWQWCCETCSDAACEHRLFTALVKADSVRP